MCLLQFSEHTALDHSRKGCAGTFGSDHRIKLYRASMNGDVAVHDIAACISRKFLSIRIDVDIRLGTSETDASQVGQFPSPGRYLGRREACEKCDENKYCWISNCHITLWTRTKLPSNIERVAAVPLAILCRPSISHLVFAEFIVY